MTINKPELRIINNTHQQETMAELKRLLDSKHMTQAELGTALKRDKTTINRWSKNSREITWDNAIKIAKVLNVHPVEVFQPRQEILIDKIIGNMFICDSDMADLKEQLAKTLNQHPVQQLSLIHLS